MRLSRFPVVLIASLSLFAAAREFTPFASAKVVLDAQRNQLPTELRNADAAKWAAWTKREDQAIRARLQRGDLDSMVNLLLYGTSFTKQPRVEIKDLAAATKAGTVRARVNDLVSGIMSPGGNERLIFLSSLLRGAGVDPSSPGESGVFIYKNLERVLEERRSIAERAAKADPATALDRQSLFSDRGVSLDTSILPNFSIEQALKDLKARGVLREGRVSRVAVVGPGLDFIDKNEASGYDYYPQQTIQPFAFYDSLIRLGLAQAGRLSLTIFDISPRVIEHVQRARERARKNAGYTIQLPRDIARPWPPELIAYWKSLGEMVGKPVAPIQPPAIFARINDGTGLETRAVSIRPEVVLACEPVDLNIVFERGGQAPFDLIVGTNIFVYYDALEQMLALENAGAMLKPGGLLLTNDRLPEAPGGSMRQAGITEVPYTRDAVGWYAKRP